MSRHARPVFANVPLHIIQRGNNRNPCFFSRWDYKLYLELLQEAAASAGCSIHAYVLMPNHIHILSTPVDETSPAVMMKQVGQRYVQYVNRTYSRTGTLWQGRYRSCLVGDERYFLTCQRYIELNPLRAGLAAHPADYEWSSYRANAYGGESTIVQPHETYLRIADVEDARLLAYRELFREEISQSDLEHVRNATNANCMFGSLEFTDKLRGALGRHSVRQWPNNRRTGIAKKLQK